MGCSNCKHSKHRADFVFCLYTLYYSTKYIRMGPWLLWLRYVLTEHTDKKTPQILDVLHPVVGRILSFCHIFHSSMFSGKCTSSCVSLLSQFKASRPAWILLCLSNQTHHKQRVSDRCESSCVSSSHQPRKTPCCIHHKQRVYDRCESSCVSSSHQPL